MISIDPHVPGASRGDHLHIEALFRAIEPLIQRRVRRACARFGVYETEDIAQECLTDIFTGLGTLTRPTARSFLAWSLVIVKRRVTDLVIRVRRPQVWHGDLPLLQDCGPSPFEPVELADEGRRVAMAMTRLPARQQQILRQRFQQDRSCAEIATREGRTRESIAMAMHRTLKRLRLELAVA